MKDLYVLVADQDMAETVQALLKRPDSLGIHCTRHMIDRHLGRDPGCRTGASQKLRPFLYEYRRAVVVLDKHGCGREGAKREDIQQEIEQDLRRNGWDDDRAKAIVIEPELETWVWTGSPHVASVLGWKRESGDLKAWLMGRGLWSAGSAKPADPKAAMNAVLRQTRTPNSAALFGEIARRTTLQHCRCSAFMELKDTLQRWFGDRAVAPPRTH